jgi:hypothetical protein
MAGGASAARIGFGVANCGVAALVAVCVFQFLPNRWWVVDGGAAVVTAALGASGAALLARWKHAERLTRAAAWVVLAIGLALALALVVTAAWLAGVYGPVGKGGAAVFGLVCALAFPYVVVLPAAELVWLGPRARDPKNT